MSKVFNSTTRPVDLDDGRTIAPGEEADDVTLTRRHNKTLLEQGFITEIEEAKSTPRRGEGTTGEDNKS